MANIVVYDGKVCPYCARTMVFGDIRLSPSRDHIKPKSRFEGNRLIIVCCECNFAKGMHTLEEYVLVLEEKNREYEEALRLNRERLENIRYLLQIGLEE